MKRTKVNKSKGKGKKQYSSLEKIQLHINKALGRPVPKDIPKLTDEEYLVFLSKMTAIKNVKIGTSNFGAGNASTFATPILQQDPTYPQIPQGMPVNLPPQISQGYDIVNGTIIPAPLPSRYDSITSGNAGRQIEAPDQQYPIRNNATRFGFHEGAGVDRGHGQSLSSAQEDSRTPYKRTRTFREPEYIGPSLVKTKREIETEDAEKRHKIYLEQAEAIRQAHGERVNNRGGGAGGRPVGSRAGEGKMKKAKEKAQKINQQLKQAEKDLEVVRDDKPESGKPQKGWETKLAKAKEKVQATKDRQASAVEEIKSLEVQYGYLRGATQPVHSVAPSTAGSEVFGSAHTVASQGAMTVDEAWEQASVLSGLNPTPSTTRQTPTTGITSGLTGLIPDIIDTHSAEVGHQDYNEQAHNFSMEQYRQQEGRRMDETETEYRNRLREEYERLWDIRIATELGI